MPFPSPEDLPNPGTEPWSPALQADSSPLELQEHPMYITLQLKKKKKRVTVSKTNTEYHRCLSEAEVRSDLDFVQKPRYQPDLSIRQESAQKPLGRRTELTTSLQQPPG